MSPADENRFYDLLMKQKAVALGTVELKELLRLTRTKSKETAALRKK
jgi:hypothetical protein